LREAIKCHFKKKVSRQRQQPNIKKVTIALLCTSQQSDAGLLTHVGIDYPFCKMNFNCSLLLSKWIRAALSLKKSAEQA
jgi:hypothetical protein